MLPESSLQNSGMISDVPRTLLVVSGEHAGQHLQRFCTADLSNLSPGEGREAMFLNTKGKLIGFVEVYDAGDHWLLAGSAGQAETLAVHLDRYVVREDVQFQDLSPSHTAIAIIGTTLIESYAKTVGPCPASMPGWTRNESDAYLLSSRELGSEGLWWIVPNDQCKTACSRLSELNADKLPADTAQALRLAHQYPEFGTDISEDHLPQELQRDSFAISFTKGCYLGQETVARIDALGHVNRLVCGITGQGEVPPHIPEEVTSSDETIGQLTSAADLGETGSWIGIATLKRKACQPSSELHVNGEPVSLRATIE
jgi:folate-binding protein YgfZ